jgi:hypothetical protein
MSTELPRVNFDANHREGPLTGLSPSARKALSVQIGEHAGGEIADLIQRMAAEIEELKRTKVSITRIVPGGEPR